MSDYNRSYKESGFTLIEVMMAIFILTVGILAALSLQSKSMQGNHKANRMTEAAFNASSVMDDLKSLDYNDPAIANNANATITSGNGLYQTTYTVTQMNVLVPFGVPPTGLLGGASSAQQYKQIIVNTQWTAFGIVYGGNNVGDLPGITSTLLMFDD